jgi:hypothetical protein
MGADVVRRGVRAAAVGAVAALVALLLEGCATEVAGAAAPGLAGPTEGALWAAATAYIDAVNAGAREGALEVTCSGTHPGGLLELGEMAPWDYEVIDVEVVGPRDGQVRVGFGGWLTGAEFPPMPFDFDGTRWCLPVGRVV